MWKYSRFSIANMIKRKEKRYKSKRNNSLFTMFNNFLYNFPKIFSLFLSLSFSKTFKIKRRKFKDIKKAFLKIFSCKYNTKEKIKDTKTRDLFSFLKFSKIIPILSLSLFQKFKKKKLNSEY